MNKLRITHLKEWAGLGITLNKTMTMIMKNIINLIRGIPNLIETMIIEVKCSKD